MNEAQQFNSENPVIEEAVGIFDTPEDLQEALDDLEQNGFMRQELTVLAEEAALVKDTYPGAAAHIALDHPDAPRMVFIPKEILGEAQGIAIGIPVYVATIVAIIAAATSGGTMGEIFLAAAVAAGLSALLGLGIARYVTHRYTKWIRSQMERGGMVLWVALRAQEMQGRATSILRRHAARDIHIHKVPLYGRYRTP